MEQTLVLIKPDGVLKKVAGRIISRFEDKGLKIEALKMVWIDEELAKSHYEEHIGKSFFQRLLSYITQAPLIAIVISGPEAIKVVRNLVGKTNPVKAEPGTIRGDLALDLESGNIVHASDSQESAAKEIDLFFSAEEIYSY
ncbi:nucleoside-diphosphate kinase [Orenia marismortui]|uniref:Nucleoside diphosphate kinase n=1 Tax=Orenia marismortui TaxID=46469 RepID=A0A4R8GZL3_9FIRM|nr:nucleoside-diphosphate kinase [Orenia marismortui]TDX52196.1 nucleoside diphosphate kinase [Orenia marismortui]